MSASTDVPRLSRRSTPRVTSACQACKQRRKRCDALRPVCSHCSQHGTPCHYDGVDLRKSRHTAVEFIALTRRIAFLEEQVASLVAASQEPPPRVDVDSLRIVHLDGDDDGNDDQDIRDTDTDDSLGFLFASLDPVLYIDPPEEPEKPPSQTRLSQALNELTSSLARLQVDQQSGETLFVGPTSNMHLGHHSREATPMAENALDPLAVPLADPLADLYTELYSEWVSNIHPGSYPADMSAVSPGEDRPGFSLHEQHLLQVYRSTVHATFPVLQDGDLAADSASRLPALLRSILLAVASHFDGSTDTHTDYLADFTAQLGRHVDQASPANVQAFLLRAYLAIFQGRLDSATMFNSMACAMAKRLGLHVTIEALEDPLSPAAARERQTTFWACLWLDRHLAVLEGRACHVDATDVSAERPLAQRQQQPGYADAALSVELLYACHVDYACLQDQVLEKLYAFSREEKTQDSITDGHVRLVSWFSSLPAAVKAVSRGKTFHPSFTSLHACFHVGLILLHRPSLLDSGPNGRLASQQCRTSAAAITTLLKSYAASFGTRPPDPMLVHAASTAGLILLVQLLSPDTAVFRSSLAALRSIMRLLFSFSALSGYASLVLQDLQEFADKWSISPANAASFWTPPDPGP